MKYILIVGSVTYALLASSSFANQQYQDEAQIEVIQVKSQKRLQDIDDLTFSVSYLSGQDIRQRLLKDTTALSSTAPNFKITQNAAEGTPPAVNIRGVGSVDYNTSTHSPVGIYSNGVAAGSANNQLVNLFDIDSVEVLRGPQGTLFGRNSTAGAVLINTVRPQQGASGYMDANFAERNYHNINGALNGSISPYTDIRLAFSQVAYDYSTNNLFEPAPEANMRQSNVRLSVVSRFKAAEIFAVGSYGEWQGTVNPAGSIGVVKLFTLSGGIAALCAPEETGSGACTDAFGFNDGSNNFYDVAVNTNVSDGSPHDSEYWNLLLEAKFALSAHSYVVSLSSFDKLDRVHYYNSDASPARLAEGNQDVITDTFSQELRYHLDTENTYLIAGLYYLSNKIKQDNRLDFFRDFRPVPALFGNAATFYYDNTIQTRSYAAFSQLEYNLSPNSALIAGLRYTNEQIDYHALGTINVALQAGDEIGLLVPGWDVNGKIEDQNWSGKLAFHQALSTQTKWFASYSVGFKSGGYNGALVNSATAAENNDYGAETLNAYEIGLVSHQLTNSRIQSSVFYYDYQNQQVFMNQAAIEPDALPLQLLSNVGESNIYGAEIELSSQLSTALQTTLSIGFLPEAKLDAFFDAAGNEIKGNRLPFTSEWNVAASIDYSYDLSVGQLIFHLDVDYQSAFYFDQNQNDYAKQSAYALWNASINYVAEQWRMSLWVKNLTDQYYSHLKFDLINPLGMLQDFKGEARQVGVGLSYEF